VTRWRLGNASVRHPEVIGKWRDLLPTCRQFDRVELWIDPEPHAQLLLLQLLDWFGTDPELGCEDGRDARRHRARASAGPMISGRCNRSSTRLTSTDSSCPRPAADAYRQPTPQAWFEIARQRLKVFAAPSQTRSVYLLAELPDAQHGIDGVGDDDSWQLLAGQPDHEHGDFNSR